MQTVTVQLSELADRLGEQIALLLGDDVPLADINANDQSGVIFIGAPYSFPKLTLEQKRLRSKLLADHERFFALAKTLLLGQPAEALKQLDMYEREIHEVVEHEYMVWHATTGEAMDRVLEDLGNVKGLVSQLHDPIEGSTVLVPDTNALISSPAFQNWQFPGVATFEVLLTPTLLHELDKLKSQSKNVAVRQKSQAIERQVKEYARRGNLSEGVNVVAGKIRVRSFAAEPRVSDALPWLDPAVQDDRLLASTIEAMRAHPRSVVALVTGDLNLQNKASFAGVPFLEPPGAVT